MSKPKDIVDWLRDIEADLSGTLNVDITTAETVSIDKGTLDTIIGTLSVWEQGKITYSTIPISSFTFDYVGGTLSTLNFFNINNTEEFELQFIYTGGTLTSIVRA